MHNSVLINSLKERRKRLKITQSDLAEISGIGLRTIKEIESGTGNPTLKTVSILLDAMGMELRISIKKQEGLKSEN